MIALEQVSKSYRNHPVLWDVNVVLPSQKIICIIGENGSGKSTFLSLLSGLLEPDQGTISYSSQRLSPRDASVSLLPQQDQLFTHLTAKDNLEFWAAAAGISFSHTNVKEAIRLLELDAFLNKKIHQLSGGMRRRVSIGTILLSDPEVLLLDEPFTGLDLYHKNELRSYLTTLTEKGKTIVYTAHNLDEIFKVADQMYAIRQGGLEEFSLPDSLDKLYQNALQLFNEDKGGEVNVRGEQKAR